MQRIHNGYWLMIHDVNRFSCSGEHIHVPIYGYVAGQQKTATQCDLHYVPCCLELSLELEGFYLCMM